MPSLLHALREQSQVACDTLDAQGTMNLLLLLLLLCMWLAADPFTSVSEELGPFHDSTSNQAIAFSELSRVGADGALLHHAELIETTISDARRNLKPLQDGLSFEEFTVEILMVKLQLLCVPNITGFVHVQTNPKLCYSTAATVKNAERIIAIFKTLAPDFESHRVCIKIPATWEGLQACRIVKAKGIATLATTIFCMEQAVLAADAKCTYVAPYVNELKVHFENGQFLIHAALCSYVDHNKAFDLCRQVQSYYLSQSHSTRVLAASLTSIEEVMHLAGVNNITVSPGLLHQLAATDASSWSGEIGACFANSLPSRSWESRNYTDLIKDESSWRLAFTRSGFGSSEGKILQAINYFSDFQDRLEELVKQHAG
ncbi:Transaldolase [Tolypocladium paradoxum]|uniref:Transaldolase n=1 Tax=Tolypocladium paradoxum TaxID=94208 RepID=A0A2S4L2Z8_9HYPO|nr:Transaldolase [Tolypocladium paradoxum]